MLLKGLCGYLNIIWTSKYLIYLFIFGYGISLGPIVWLYLAEILPSKGISVATLVVFSSSTSLTFLFPILKDSIGINGLFFLYASLRLQIYLYYSFLGLIFIIIFVKETKSKSKLEIE